MKAHGIIRACPGRRTVLPVWCAPPRGFFLGAGVTAASPEAIAERGGAGNMLIFWHFRHFFGKDDLLTATLVDREQRHCVALVDAPPEVGRLKRYSRYSSEWRAPREHEPLGAAPCERRAYCRFWPRRLLAR